MVLREWHSEESKNWNTTMRRISVARGSKWKFVAEGKSISLMQVFMISKAMMHASVAVY
jgi:hypothetical protein